MVGVLKGAEYLCVEGMVCARQDNKGSSTGSHWAGMQWDHEAVPAEMLGLWADYTCLVPLLLVGSLLAGLFPTTVCSPGPGQPECALEEGLFPAKPVSGTL